MTSMSAVETAFAGRRQALTVLLAILFLTFLDNTIVSVAVGDINNDLHAGVSELQWVVNGYALVFAALMLAGGTLGDLFGRKKVMLGGAVVFCAGSVLSALAPNVDTLIVGRVVMGVGAAASEPGTLSMLRQLFPDREERARALGFWAATSGLALAAGPVIGGTLIGIADWRSVFWFNLGFGLLAFAAAAVVLPESADPEGRRLDVPGLLFGAIALAAATFGVIQGETSGYYTWWILALFAVAVLAAAGFIITERRVRSPVIDLRFFRNSTFSGANLVAFVAFFGTFAIFFFVALYLYFNPNVDYNGYQTAEQFLTMTAAMIAASILTGRWVARSGPRLPIAVGCAVAGIGILLTDQVLTQTGVSFWQLALALILTGAGFGTALVPVTSSVLSVVPANRSGMAASATNTSREVGAVFGVAVLGAVVDTQITSHLKAELHALHIPANFQGIVQKAVEKGGQGALSAKDLSKAGQYVLSHPGFDLNKFQDDVTNAALRAFDTGLDIALLLSGAMLLAAAVIAYFTVRSEVVDLGAATANDA